jgi:hypothetical protein
LLEIGVSRVMFSADCRHDSMAKARAFLEQIPVSSADRARGSHVVMRRNYWQPTL